MGEALHRRRQSGLRHGHTRDVAVAEGFLGSGTGGGEDEWGGGEWKKNGYKE